MYKTKKPLVAQLGARPSSDQGVAGLTPAIAIWGNKICLN